MNKQKLIEILSVLLPISIGLKPATHSLVDEMYEQNSLEYFKEYKKVGEKENVLYSMFTVSKEDRIRKLAGILGWAFKNERYEEICKLIKIAYPETYRYFTQRTLIDMDGFTYFIMKNKEIKSPNIWMVHNLLVIHFLCFVYEKEIVSDEYMSKFFAAEIEFLYLESPNPYKNAEIVENNQELIKKLDSRLNVIPKKKTSSYHEYITSFIFKELEEICKKSRHKTSDSNTREFNKKTPYRHHLFLNAFLDASGVSANELFSSLPYSKETAEETIAFYALNMEESELKEEEFDIYFFALLALKSIIKAYHEAKDMLLANHDSFSQRLVGIEEKEKEIKEAEAQLTKKEREWAQHDKAQQEKIRALEEKINQLEKQVKRQENEKKVIEDNSKELIALRNYIYEINQESRYAEKVLEDDMKDIINILKAKNIVIAGGHPNWQNKLKSIVPSLNFVDTDQLNRDLCFLNRTDAVYVNTTYMNHPFYYKVMEKMRRNDIPLYYLKGNSNIDFTIQDIYRSVNQIKVERKVQLVESIS